MGVLSAAQVNDLWAFQRAAGARSVKFAAWPTNVGFNPDTAACTSASTDVAFTPDMPLAGSGIKPTAPVNMAGLYRCPAIKAQPLGSCNMWAADFAATGIAAPCAATSVLDVAPAAAGGNATDVAGALLRYADGRESLAFMFSCADWSPACLLLGHAALHWLLRGLIPGQRAAILSVQVRANSKHCALSQCVCV